MTRRDAVKSALAFNPVWPVPYHFDFTHDMRAKLQQHFGVEDVDKAVGNYMLQINVGSNAGAEINRTAAPLMESIGENTFRDEFGVVWDKSGGGDIGIPKNQVLGEPDLSLLRMPDVEDPRRWGGYAELAETAGDRYLMACFSSPLYQRAWFLRGMGDLLMDMATNEEFVEGLLDRLAEFSIGIVRGVAKRGADGIIFYDDYAQQKALLFSPAMFKRYFAPRLARIFGEARKAGLDVFFHCCGAAEAILDDLLAAGAQVFNPFQPEVMDTAAMAQKYRGRLAFYGGISTQHTLPFGKPDEVRAECRRMQELFRESGGYILAGAHAIQRDVPMENVLALLDAAREF
jgi:uroporphyrinogen decarboxylase